MNNQAYQRPCLHCGELFTPSPANRSRQKYCTKPECQKVRATRSHKEWLKKNPKHFTGSANVFNVQEWRKLHPGYWKKKKNGSGKAKASTKGNGNGKGGFCPGNECDTCLALKVLAQRNPLIIGMLAKLSGLALKDSIFEELERLVDIGRGILAQETTTPPNDNRAKTNHAT